jgi:hypothetical protein
MIPSTIAGSSWRAETMICSAILSGSSWLKNSLGRPILAIPLSTARLPIFAAREGTIPCQPIPPTMTPGICWTLWGSMRTRA